MSPEKIPTVDADGTAIARAARLRYVHDTSAGIQRVPDGEGFRYLAPDGAPITDEATLERIRQLVIPPAYTDVWICPAPNGHLQATGRDARGRKQYRYHVRWRAVRDSTKYDRMIAFGEALPTIRERVEADLSQRGMPLEKVLAAVVRLLETTRIRIGNEEYARDNDSYGLTTLKNDHVAINGATIHFHFRGKSGKTHDIDIRDRRLARIVARCQELPEQELFEYIDTAGNCHDITSGDVNHYLQETTGEEFTAKDFRTWAGTVLCAITLSNAEATTTATARKQTIVQAVKTVAERLGNTPAVCRTCYIHPAILNAYTTETLPEAMRTLEAVSPGPPGNTALTSAEKAVLDFLRNTKTPP